MQILSSAVSVFLTVLIVGCASFTQESRPPVALETAGVVDMEARLYQIYIGSSGELLDPSTQQSIRDEEKYLDEIFKNFDNVSKKNRNLRLTIFVHGGLNTFESATARVQRVKDLMIADGKYPIFISWDSGFPGNYVDHLFYVRRGERAPVRGGLSSPVVFLEDIVRSIVRIPASTYNVFFGQASTVILYDSKEEKAARRSAEQIDKEKHFKIHNSAADIGHSFGDFWTIANPLKLVTAPFVDGLGTGAWNSMLRRTDLVLRKSEDFNGAPSARSGTAAAKFLKRWQDKTKDRPDEFPVTLVGHSMGTIIANNIISKYQRINFANIVYMGAACTTKDIEYVVTPYLERNTSAKFYNLTLNPYREVNERHFGDVIPRGSLLIWIDQTLASINSFQDRTAGIWFNTLRSANQVFEDPSVRGRVHLVQFGIRDGSPQNHGDFGKCPFWREEFWTRVDYGEGGSTRDLKC